MSLELAMITPHTPRICHRDRIPEFQKPMVEAMVKCADMIDQANPDVVVLISCHWMSSFFHYVDITPRHQGILTAVECPDLITDVPYDYVGHPELGRQLVQAGKAAGMSVVGIDDPTYIWDYGTVVPLRYLLKRKETPVVDLSVCWAASIEESIEWGRIIGQVFEESPLRVVFLASGALAHNLGRTPELWPNITEQALDREFCNYLVNGDRDSAVSMLPSYVRAAGVESGGRHVAVLLGVLQNKFKGELHGYGPSSGSGNPVLTIRYAG
ncbi:extradiol ring-cleavage dioxygenase [Alicyclobacillus acidoterrestris]|uniref:Extradiol ring-cleavage dioxygenase n=1 Tax=Alicyclobacillus acidoterrestris (strain ATCC 49025 / DSM 3922 / CIP 106132 / NCIMB 13137 / GD3B) TaxID=1356854 RepID=T0CZC4_ALIAG|nr:extradiol ring-cleavage dioxygenase [Alicyclobacillus acidoterrestris]EPZ42916.1 extradiol ring-cleavage dioxygenase [Alicyclobacillus acidoterrestris ATCC 49025]UNO50065.1 extradiol ring-cleavage dioxygenase [Alicyclobacillus acidoterrestris]